MGQLEQKLHVAVNGGNLQEAKDLLEMGADVNDDRVGLKAAICAPCENKKDMVLLLLEHQADINKASGLSNYTPLMEAVSRKEKEIVEILLERGADLSAVNKNGETALDLAKAKGDVEIIRLFQNK